MTLFHKPSWLAGIGCDLVAFGCQAVALGFAPVAVVEPLICLELVFALPLAFWFRGYGSHGQRQRGLGMREWLGAACVVAGVGLFLALSSPAGGSPEPDLVIWAKVAVPVLAAISLGLLLARGPETPRRAMLLAASAGLCFSLLALVTQSFVTLVADAGVAGAFASWQAYVLLGFGVTGFTIAQSAYQAAPLAVSLPIIDSVEPTVAVVLASLLFGQRLSIAPGALALESFGALLALSGIWLLGRSPLVISIYEQQQAEKDRKARHALTGIGSTA